MSARRVIEHATCLGCGCACDDIDVAVQASRIVAAERACPLGVRWFGDGTAPDRVIAEGKPAELEAALDVAAKLLAVGPGRVLVLFGLDVPTETHRAALALADRLRAAVDGPVSATAAAGILAGQRRGRATATLGEIRNRGDLLVFWGVDPDERYPRFLSRYALEPTGIQVHGRADRGTVAVDVGTDRGPAAADARIAVAPADEEPALALMRAAVLGRPIGEPPPAFAPAIELARRLTGARYAVVVHDAEPGRETAETNRAEGLIALTQALNGPTRAALISLRGGGNRSGAESASTWQTGYPFAVDFTPGYPTYGAYRRGLARLTEGAFAAALVVGRGPDAGTPAADALGRIPTVAIGPFASAAPWARVAIDTGVAGIHDDGTAYRMDDVPLPLRPPLAGMRRTRDVVEALGARIATGAAR